MTEHTKTPHLHERLGLTFAQLGALLGVRELLKMEALEFAHRGGYITWENAIHASGSAHLFNMNVACRMNEHCGSVGCIGGSMGLLLGMTAPQATTFTETAPYKLRELFYPKMAKHRYVTVDYDKITPAQAIKAINNFLAGKRPWEGIKLVPVD